MFWPEVPWPETRTRWIAEGMTDDYDFGFDPCNSSIDLEIGYWPAWETGVVRDEGNHVLMRDQYGIIRRSSKAGRPDIAQYVTFPVSDRKSWEELRPRLAADAPGRFEPGWSKQLDRVFEGLPLSFGRGHLCGFFSFLRELFGDEEVYYLLADDPDLAREILDFQVARLSGMLKHITAEVKVDRVAIWEDMCYKNGPLISPEMFRKFILEPCRHYIENAKSMGVEIFDVDSDGKVDKLLPLWIEAGVNMHHPFEVQAGMDVNEVLSVSGSGICVCGGIDKRELAKGREAIDSEVERIRPAFETGRYIPFADHSIPPDVSFDDYQYYTEKRAELVGAI